MQDLKSIIENKTECFFVSPHLDDAAFSAGELMRYLSDKVGVTVINVFTSPGDAKNSLSARAYLKQCQSNDAKELFHARIDEDQLALTSIGVKVYNLGYTEALWRRQKTPQALRKALAKFMPEFDRLHPTYRFDINSGKIKKEDKELIEQIANYIRHIIGNDRNIQIFCPVAHGNHIDHVITREACRYAFGDNLIYWSDIPYSQKITNRNNFQKENNLKQESLQIKTENKLKLCELYSTQFKSSIGDGRVMYKPEVFYLKNDNKNKFDVDITSILTYKLLDDWEELWHESELKNYFNSPKWFLVCLKAFNYEEMMIISCYEEQKLVGILPLVLARKNGIYAYLTPGEKYYDSSSLLLSRNDPHITKAIIEKLKDLGSFYLNEIGEYQASDIFRYVEKVIVKKSSVSVYLPLTNDPDRFISKKNRKVIFKQIEQESENFKLKKFEGLEQLDTVVHIESHSRKAIEHKDVLSDPQLISLFKNIQQLDAKSFAIFLLYYKDEPISYIYGYIYGKTFHDINTAYKDNYNHLIPGKVIARLLFAKLQEMGIEKIDFARGDTRFKREFTPYYYDQYVVFYSKSFITRLSWSLEVKLRNYLEKHPKVFTSLRNIKAIFLEGRALLCKAKIPSLLGRETIGSQI